MEKKTFDGLDLTLYYEKLENGLEIYIVPKNNINNIYATFSTKYGSNISEFVPINQKKMKKFPLGIAHFLEHKLFEQKDGTDAFSFFSERGAGANANTSNFKTTYLFNGASCFEENLSFLLNYVQEPYFTDENVLKERGIIEQEIKMYQDDPYTSLYEGILYNIFNDHPMKFPIIGTIDSINSITKEDLYECYNTFYHPSNMFVVVTGNVEPLETIKIIKDNQSKKTFEKESVFKTKKYSEANEVFKKYASKKMNVSIPKVMIGYKIDISSFKDTYKTLFLIDKYFISKIGKTSILSEKLLQEQIINDEIYLSNNLVDNYLVFYVAAETKFPERFITEVKKCLEKKDVSEEDFTRKKKVAISQLIYLSDNITAVNSKVMNDIIKYNKVNTDIYKLINNYDYDDFIEVISKINLSFTSEFVIEPY